MSIMKKFLVMFIVLTEVIFFSGNISFDDVKNDIMFRTIYQTIVRYNPNFTWNRFYELIEGMYDGFLIINYIESNYPSTKWLETNQNDGIIDTIYDVRLYFGIGITETKMKNIIGDYGESIGYFQIQYETYNWVLWIVKTHFPEVFDLTNFTRFKNKYEFKKLIYNPKLQGTLVVLTIYFINRYITNGNFYQTIIYYNSGRPDLYDTIYLRRYRKHLQELLYINERSSGVM